MKTKKKANHKSKRFRKHVIAKTEPLRRRFRFENEVRALADLVILVCAVENDMLDAIRKEQR